MTNLLPMKIVLKNSKLQKLPKLVKFVLELINSELKTVKNFVIHSTQQVVLRFHIVYPVRISFVKKNQMIQHVGV